MPFYCSARFSASPKIYSFTRYSAYGSHCNSSTRRASSPFATTPCRCLSTAHHIWTTSSPPAYRQWHPTHWHPADPPRLFSSRYVEHFGENLSVDIEHSEKLLLTYNILTHIQLSGGEVMLLCLGYVPC